MRTSVLPKQVQGHFHQEGDVAVVSGHNLDSPSDMVREAAYKIYYWREEEQEEVLTSMLQDRHSLAQLCGYETFAHRALSHSLAEAPENLKQFHSVLGTGLQSRVAKVKKISILII